MIWGAYKLQIKLAKGKQTNSQAQCYVDSHALLLTTIKCFRVWITTSPTATIL